MINLALLYGGRSAERDVSIAGAKEVEKALDKEKYMIFKYDAATDLEGLVHDAARLDCVFILLHGKYGEDGTIQGLLDLLDLPYQSAGVLGSSMAMDKHVSKIMYRQAGLLTPEWMYFRRGDSIEVSEIEERVGLPLVVKPCNQGSSVGITLVKKREKIRQSIENAFSWDNEVIVEAYIKGTEITGGVLGLNDIEALPIVEIIPGNEFTFFDYKAKYTPGATREICPARIDADLTTMAQNIAKKAHEALKLTIYSRTDMMLTDDGEIYCIETNTIPGMTLTSLFPQAAKVHGFDFPSLLDKLIELAMERKKLEKIKNKSE